jgi:hypothetical protein
MSVETLKILGQTSPAATTNTTLYTVPTKTQAVISTLAVANTTNASVTIRVFIVKSGASAAQTNALYYELSIPANETLAATMGITLAASDAIVVYASTTNVVFHAFGNEVAPL